LTPPDVKRIIDQLPEGSLFAGATFRIAPVPFKIPGALKPVLERLGDHLLHFYKATNLIYRYSSQGTAPAFVSDYLNRGKPDNLIQLSLLKRFNGDVPCVIRPDLVLRKDGFSIVELDSVPGGIGLTGYLNEVYERESFDVIGKSNGMTSAFARMCIEQSGTAKPFVALVISEEAAMYRPELAWLATKLIAFGVDAQAVRPEDLRGSSEGVFFGERKIDLIYRFFELFDLPHIQGIEGIIKAVEAGTVKVTPPFKPVFEEKMWLSLFSHQDLQPFFERHLGRKGIEFLKPYIPETAVIDPAPLPPQGILPVVGLRDWNGLKTFSQKERQLIIKISGFSTDAWGSRGVYCGHDMSAEDWSGAIDTAIGSFATNPYILQKFSHSDVFEVPYYDATTSTVVIMPGRVRLCPYYFVVGEKTELGGVLATICPIDKKLLHGMEDAILAPCTFEEI